MPLFGRWARWGWLATTVALGAALLATAWMGRERVRAAASTLDLGQGQLLLEELRQAVREEPGLPDSARLDSLVRVHADGGLRYLAIFDSERRLLVAAGTPVAGTPSPPREAPPRPGTVESVDGRLRMTGSVMPARAPAAAGQPPDAGPAESQARPDGPRQRFRPPMLVLEFEPLAAERLVAEATRVFALSAAVACALLGLALLFWRLTVLQQVTERHLEQQRRLGMLGEMSAVLAHEIRNPLASLKGNAQLLAEHLGAGSADGRKAELVVDEARRLEALTGDLLDFARSGPMDIRPADPADLARACLAEVDGGAFVLHADAAPAVWPFDAPRLRLALTNVLRNARQVSPEGTRPEVTVRRDGNGLLFEIRDFGPGVPAGEERRIFSPFYTTRTQGTGLGLAVALRVAELHEGTITVANHPEGGAVFRIVLPGS
jgi:two-component system sensor histidine kinase HydH